jgi:hypothetical protein
MSMTIQTTRGALAPQHLPLRPLPTGASLSRRALAARVQAARRKPEPCPLSAAELRRIVLETMG